MSESVQAQLDFYHTYRKGVITLDKVKVETGQHVVYVDPKGVARPAVVTVAWSHTCVNVVFVSDDKSKTDSYGRQIERETSVIHASTPGRAHGNYWYATSPDEKLDETHQPQRYCL